MHKAVEDTAKAGAGSNESIANVAVGGDANGNGKKANKDSVTGIAKGMKAIVDAAKKAGVELKADDVAGAAGANDGDAGKLFANGGAGAAGANDGDAAGRLFANGGAGDAAADAQGAAEKAGEAVSAVSGDQILKAIVDAAGSTEGKGANTATNAVEAAIGADAAGGAEGVAFGDDNMKKNQIAAAIVLRGLAKDGKFANANDAGANGKVVAAKKASGWIKEMHKAVEDTAKAGDGGSDLIANVAAGGNGDGDGAGANVGSVTGIAKGMKAIVDAAKKAGVEFKPAAAVANGGNNAGGAAGNDADAQGAAAKAGEAVSAVSGDQILKAIVDAAETTTGAGAGTATNAVEAAIGGDGGDGAAAAFAGDMKKNQIAAAIVLRGLAKDGKFANANAGDAGGNVKAAVKSAVGWIKEMNKAVEDTAKAGTGSNESIANAAANGKVVAAVKSAVGWIKEMHKAVEDTAKAGTGSNESIANVAVGGGNGNGNGAGKKADEGSVTGIAKGMKAIVDAAKKADVEFKPDDVNGDNGNNAGRLFASGDNGNAGVADAAQGAAAKAGEAVSAVSGDQILKAIVDAAGTTEGKRAGDAKNAVEAAIGGDGEGGDAAAFGNNMKKKNQIAAAIVLRGLAKDGKFANTNAADGDADGKVKAAVKTSEWIKEMHKAVEDTAKAGTGSESIANVAAGGADDGAGKKANVDSVTGIAKGMKAIVDAAKKAGVELKAADVADAGDAAGRLFANGDNGAGEAQAQGAAAKAGEAVGAVSGDQILKAIVDAAGSTEGKGANTAKNAVGAAIGADGAEGVAFGDAGMQKKNQIAAAIVLRGLAKGGKFANANAGANTKVKAAVKTSEWIKEMHKAVEDTAKAGDGSNESIANVAAGGADAAGNGAKANKGSVTGIAKGMKAIVDAAKKAGVELKATDVNDGGANDAGRLFASGNANGNAGGEADAQGAAAKAGEAVSAVSGDQILKAIVDAAETTKGAGAAQAKNAVEAAIGDAGAGNGAGVAFGDNMKKKNQIAAAIVLRGLAKDGKFANANDAGGDADGKVKAAVKTSEWIKEMHKAVEDTAKAGTGGNESIAVGAAGGNAAAGKKANKDSVTGIAKGMKAIVDAAKKAGVELKADDVDGAGDADAGRLFANGAAGNAGEAQGAAEKAGEAVSAVSGDQILKAIVDAAETTEGAGAGQAKNAVEAAIGGAGGNAAAFGNGNMKKNQIAAAIVLRGLAKDGKFANANDGDADGKVKAAVKTSEWMDKGDAQSS